MNETKIISILVPVYNEAEVLLAFYERITNALQQTAHEYELIFVDDGSTDSSLLILEALAKQDPHVKIIIFSRNFGKEAAMSAAIDFAIGDAAIPIDADLQDPPELIPALVAQWELGFEVVLAKRESRTSDTFIKRQTAAWFYRLFNRVSEVEIPDNVGDFRLMDRKVLEILRTFEEKDRFMKGLYSWPGFRHTSVSYDRPGRNAGNTKFNYWRLWNFALNGITSFSTFPIRISVYLGLMISASSFLFGFFILFKTLIYGIDTPGYASIMVVMLFLGGIQMFFLGLMGEYIGRIYKEVKNRPLYVVNRKVGIADE